VKRALGSVIYIWAFGQASGSELVSETESETNLTWPRHKEKPLPTNGRKIKIRRMRELLQKSAKMEVGWSLEVTNALGEPKLKFVRQLEQLKQGPELLT